MALRKRHLLPIPLLLAAVFALDGARRATPHPRSRRRRRKFRLASQRRPHRAQFGVLLPFSRERETEADAMGLLYMARAGYDPREALSFWQRMENSGGRQPPEFISTHPSHESRIHRLQELMPKALAVYESSSTKS